MSKNHIVIGLGGKEEKILYDFMYKYMESIRVKMCTDPYTMLIKFEKEGVRIRVFHVVNILSDAVVSEESITENIELNELLKQISSKVKINTLCIFADKGKMQIAHANLVEDLSSYMYIRSKVTGKLELHFYRDCYNLLEDNIKDIIKSNFTYDTESETWMSNDKYPNLQKVTDIVKELGMFDGGVRAF